MSINYRVKKKRRNPRDRRITLDAEHQKKLQEFENLHERIPQLRRELTSLCSKRMEMENAQRQTINFDPVIGKKLYQLHQEIHELRAKIANIESGHMEDIYYAKTAHLLYEYYDNIRKVAQRKNEHSAPVITAEVEQLAQEGGIEEPPKRKTVMDFFQTPRVAPASRRKKMFASTKISDFMDMKKKFHRANLLEKYTKVVNPKSYRPASQARSEIDLCPSCEAEMTLIQAEGILVCQQCGREESIVIDSEKPSYKDPPPEAGEFTYKRINRLEEWLTQYQAKETTEIPQEVLDKILLEMKKERIKNMACLSMEKVRGYLKKLKLNKYYEHIPHIIYCLNGLPTPRFRPELEDRLRVMFREIQEIFDQVCPPDRTNFLSYSYLLAKLLELLGEDEHKKYFRFHKSRDKIYQHDQVWKKICKLLRWEYIRTV